MAKMASIQKRVLIEKRKSAAAVIAVLTAVTSPAPKRFVSLSLIRLENTVPRPIITETMLAKPSGTPNCPLITGQAEPSRESGNPRLTKLK